jgi:hypothetical protein
MRAKKVGPMNLFEKAIRKRETFLLQVTGEKKV